MRTLGLLLVVAWCTPVIADSEQPERWQMVAEQTQASFRVRLLGVLSLDGRFDDLSGVVLVDKSDRSSQS